MENYYYELKCVHDKETVVHKFPSDLTAYQLALQLGDFLRGCSWTDNQVKSILKLDEEEDDV